MQYDVHMLRWGVKNGNKKDYLEVVYKDNDKLYPIRTKNCLNHIFHYKNIDLINQVKKIANVNTFRIELFEETSEEVIKIVERLKKEIGI